MKDITVIIPVHKIEDEFESLFSEAVSTVNNNIENIKGEFKVKTVVVTVKECEDNVRKLFKETEENKILVNDTGKSDFCSQINFAVDRIDTDFFSILEFDDGYTDKWFSNVAKYYYGNEHISVFLPVNLYHDGEGKNWEYGNTMALTPAFMTSKEEDNDDIGIINYDRLEKCSLFNLTGSVINTNDFKEVGRFKPSIEVAFNYEFLLRLTKRGLKCMVIPKEGYIHALGRKGSLSEYYMTEMDSKERDKWFNVAMRECKYKEEREINGFNEEEIK